MTDDRVAAVQLSRDAAKSKGRMKRAGKEVRVTHIKCNTSKGRYIGRIKVKMKMTTLLSTASNDY